MASDTRPRRWPKASYDPRYDPMVDAGPGHNRDHAPTYWIGTAGTPPEDDGPVSKDMDVDVVVVGSGYTGLSTAIHLAKEHGIKATVLEANTVAWGCSTRNGGQAQISSGRLKRSQWIARWGVDVAKKMHAEVCEAFDAPTGTQCEQSSECSEVNCDSACSAFSDARGSAFCENDLCYCPCRVCADIPRF